MRRAVLERLMRPVVWGVGLATALSLARAGHAVQVLERDATPLPPSPVEAFESWERNGAPQVWHSHAFLARLRNGLLARAPDVLDALHAHGANDLRFRDYLPPTIVDRTPAPGDDELTLFACRRITFEWVLRQRVLANRAVSCRRRGGRGLCRRARHARVCPASAARAQW
jgi:2-polyprenyl-6-methoxyphenol hydroxylase-like FAD-dependent oxidoreductase